MPVDRAYGLIVAFVVSVLAGCGHGGGPPGESVGASPLLEPFAGRWKFDRDATLATLRESGAPDAEIDAMVRSPESAAGLLSARMTVGGNTATGAEDASQLYLFHVHTHDGFVCGKAWHHEDRHDPGDMSKCQVRLWLNDGLLLLKVRMQETLPDLADPDLIVDPAAEGGSPKDCPADGPPPEGWSDWITAVYARDS